MCTEFVLRRAHAKVLILLTCISQSHQSVHTHVIMLLFGQVMLLMIVLESLKKDRFHLTVVIYSTWDVLCKELHLKRFLNHVFLFHYAVFSNIWSFYAGYLCNVGVVIYYIIWSQKLQGICLCNEYKLQMRVFPIDKSK